MLFLAQLLILITLFLLQLLLPPLQVGNKVVASKL